MRPTGIKSLLRILAAVCTLGAIALFASHGSDVPWWLMGSALLVLAVGLTWASVSDRLSQANPGTPAYSPTGTNGIAQAAAAGTGVSATARTTTFDDVAGLDEVLSDLRELVNYMKERDKYIALDARLPRGVLLYGPPGTGKTLLAKALAAEAGANFLYASGSSFVEKYVGVGAQRVRELFAKARQQTPAVLFIDEIDSVGRSRGQNGESSEWDTALNQLLTELDGFESAENIMLVCATNRKEMLDEALLRPGRLDRHIYIGLPDLGAREAILKTHTRKKPLAPDVDLNTIARQTPGFSGAHLAAAANEAALTAARETRTTVTMSDFDGALNRVMAGETGHASVLSEEDRRLVAFHEAGHALVGWILGQGAIEKITLLNRSQALGFVLQVPEERALNNRAQLRARIAVLLGGRAAEEHITGDFSTGAADDLKKATNIAEKMVTEFGMSDRLPHQVVREQSLVFSRKVSAEVSKIIAAGWETATALVNQYDHALRDLAHALLERETLNRDAVEAILSKVDRAGTRTA